MWKLAAQSVNAVKATWNVLRSVGPFLISQSDRLSESYARHLGRKASVEAGKEFLLARIKTYCAIEKKLLEKLIDSNPEEEIRIATELNEVQALMRQSNIGVKALTYFPAGLSEEADTASLESEFSISEHWIDKFNQLARSRNEPWRAELLARALAAESNSPGSISPRALWLIGVLEERTFKAFGVFLDLCANINGYQIVLDGLLDEQPISDCLLGMDVTVAQVIVELNDSGLISDPLANHITAPKHQTFAARYQERIIRVTTGTEAMEIGGATLTNFGKSIAMFYEARLSEFGMAIFDLWIKRLPKTERCAVEIAEEGSVPVNNKVRLAPWVVG